MWLLLPPWWPPPGWSPPRWLELRWSEARWWPWWPPDRWLPWCLLALLCTASSSSVWLVCRWRAHSAGDVNASWHTSHTSCAYGPRAGRRPDGAEDAPGDADAADAGVAALDVDPEQEPGPGVPAAVRSLDVLADSPDRSESC